MVSHEYGEKLKRPHHHCILFGYNPKNQKFLKNTKGGHPLFTAPEIDELWKHGYHSIGQANEKTAYYIASYALKGKSHTIQEKYGELIQVTDSMDCSKRPSIGKEYFMKNYKQMLDSNELLPRYYQKLLQQTHPDLFEEYENSKIMSVKNRGSEHLLAAYVIKNQKKSLLDGEFRTAPLDETEKGKKRHLEYHVENLNEENRR